MRIVAGIPEDQRGRAAALYWEAFGSKLRAPLGPRDRGVAFVERVLRADHAISALDDDGCLVGVAGFKTARGALVGGGLGDLAAVYGWAGAAWRGVLSWLLERDVENDRFLMDGLFVAEDARGRGVGTLLLDALCREARARGYREIRLDVVDTNPRARALYERYGFEAFKTEDIGVLRFLYGFRHATAMALHVSENTPGGVRRTGGWPR